jgi:hypothetical protein
MKSYDIKDDIINDFSLYKSFIVFKLNLDLKLNLNEELELILVVFPL